MFGALLYVGGWALVGALIFFCAYWSGLERAFFANGGAKWRSLE